jgi:hypothetical protein
MDAVDPARCPLCGGANACALACPLPVSADGARGECWCTRVAIDSEVLRSVAPAALGRACVCAQCVAAARTASPRA